MRAQQPCRWRLLGGLYRALRQRAKEPQGTLQRDVHQLHHPARRKVRKPTRPRTNRRSSKNTKDIPKCHVCRNSTTTFTVSAKKAAISRENSANEAGSESPTAKANKGAMVYRTPRHRRTPLHRGKAHALWRPGVRSDIGAKQ